jgi:hypothetical protein
MGTSRESDSISESSWLYSTGFNNKFFSNAPGSKRGQQLFVECALGGGWAGGSEECVE